MTDNTTSAVCKASGALWFGGYLRPDGTFVGTDTGFIDGSEFTFNFGTCAAPG